MNEIVISYTENGQKGRYRITAVTDWAKSQFSSVVNQFKYVDADWMRIARRNPEHFKIEQF